ncbi:MAG: hypothetical protein ABW252_19750 [Polyangiales bacterium]
MTERPPAEDELLVDDGDDALGAGSRDLPLEIDLDPGVGETAPTRPGGGDQRARFVAESQPLGSDGPIRLEPGDDDPTLAFAPLDPDDRDTHSTVRLRRIPPALPATLRPPEPPKVLLGPDLSMRNEITERMPLIPKTHPMANSIAPGGSALTLPPTRRTPWGWFASGVAALIALGVGASHSMQSPGENHAATGRSDGSRHAAAMPVTAAVAEATRAATSLDAPAPTRAEPTVGNATIEIAEAAPQAAPPKTVPPASPEARSPSEASAASPADAPAIEGAPSPLRLEVGDAAIRPRERPFRPSLGAIGAAVDGVRDQVRACAGDAHGIADVVLRVQASGVVSHVQVHSGPFADSPVGSCIAKVMRKARVAPFRKPVAHILYTLRL